MQKPQTRYSLLNWIRRYPGRAAGWGYLSPSVALAASGLFKASQGDIWGGASIFVSGMAEVAAATALIRYADPEISAADKTAGYIDMQDRSLWERLKNPKQAPHEFGGVMGIPSTLGLIGAAAAQPSLVTVTMAAPLTLTIMAQLVGHKDKDQLEKKASTAFGKLVERGQHWMQENPNRAVFYTALPCNIAQLVDGWQRKDPFMFGSGAIYMGMNWVRSFSSKRARILGETAQP